MREPRKWQVRLARGGLRGLLALPTPVKRAIAGKPVRVDGQELNLDTQVILRFTPQQQGTPPNFDAATARAAQRVVDLLVLGPEVTGVSRTDSSLPHPHGHRLATRLYVPDGSPAPSPLLVFYHGGGFVTGGLDSHDGLCALLATRAGVRVLAVDYRLAPEHPFPAAVEDCLATYRHVLDNAAEFGTTPESVAVGGDSAGGSLALTVAHENSGSEATPAFLLAFFPLIGPAQNTRSRRLFGEGFFLTDDIMTTFANWYLPTETERNDPRLRLGQDAELSGMPPAHFSTAGFDPLRDEGEEFAHRLAAAGVPVSLHRQSDLPHGFATALGIGTRPREAVAEAAGALRGALALLEAR